MHSLSTIKHMNSPKGLEERRMNRGYDVKHKCHLCEEIIGYIDIKLGSFDPRCAKNYEKHCCEQYKEVG